MKKPRIAVWHNLPSGGGKRQLYYHVKGLIERGYEVESWCPDTADQKFLPLGSLVKEHIVPLNNRRAFVPGPIRPAGKIKAMVSAMEDHCRKCAEEIKGRNFDLVFANACMFFRTTPLAKYLDVPSLIYLGEPYRWFYEAIPELPWISTRAFENPSKVKKFLASILHGSLQEGVRLQALKELEYARAFDRILCNSSYSRESILRAYDLESTICYLGIDADLYHPTSAAKQKAVVGLGTIYHAKGVDRAIRAVATIDPERRPALIWIGNGANARDLQDYTHLAAENNVTFIPRIHLPDAEVVELLGTAAVMIYTSRLEPFGLAPLEANACGTPVVAIAEGGVKESIRDGVNGFLVNQDDPGELGKLIAQFTSDLEYAKRFGEQAKDYVLKNWSLKNCTDNLENILLNFSR
jgi:glycosyltransferase involved in cell wall biosynthesis